jgi:hypothetical protein
MEYLDSDSSLFQVRVTVGKIVSRFLVAVLLAALTYTLSLPALRAAEKPLTHDDVTLLLLGGASSQKLIDLVKQRGIDFQMTAEVATEFRRDGADDSVIQALESAGKGASQASPSAAPPASNSTSPTSPPAASSSDSSVARPTLIRPGDSRPANPSASAAPTLGASGNSGATPSSQSAPTAPVGADGISPATSSGPSIGVPSSPDATQSSSGASSGSSNSSSSSASSSSNSSSGPTLVRHRAPVVSVPPEAPAAAHPAAAGSATVPAATASAAAPAKVTGLDLSDPGPERQQQIIQAFAAKEALFKVARDNYTYHQINKVEEIGPDGEVTGRYQQDWDILYDDNGSRIERVSYAPPDSLHQLILTEQDLDAFRNIQPFVLTTAELPEYDVQYRGHVKVDELTAYVFSIRPKEIQKGKQYFQGLVWVDDRDLQIVKTEGKNVPEIKSKGNENLFPRFTSWREQIDGKFWFPTYTLADDTLYFSGGPPVHVKEIIRYTDYKQFGSRVIIGDVSAVPNSQSSEQPKKPAQDQKTPPPN